MYFNERHGRVGHLFQNRYKSRVVSKDSYLREAIRYIHLNPVRAGLISSLEELEDYPWTGHRQIMEDGDAGWVDIEILRWLFSGTGKSGWKDHYREFIGVGCSACSSGEGVNGDKKQVFLDDKYSADYLSPDNVRPPEKFYEILARVSAQTGIPVERILGGGKKYFEVNARRVVLSACKAGMDVSAAMVSRWLGISEACGSYLLRTQHSKRRSF
jgi:hypothetical protein